MIDLWAKGSVLWDSSTTAPGTAQLDAPLLLLLFFFHLGFLLCIFNMASFSSRNGRMTKRIIFFLPPFVVKSSCRATVALLPSRLLSSGSGQTRHRTKPQSSPRDGDRASASGVSLRRGDAGVQVGELPPHLHVVLFLPVLLLLF